MNSEDKAGLVLGGMILMWWLACTSVTVYGLYLVFSASVVLGLCALVIPLLWPIVPLTALLAIFTDVNLPEKILSWF